MTHLELRDLLEEQVADLTTTDLSATAWRSATRIRRRRRGAAVGGVAALVLAVAGVAAIVDTVADPHSDGGPASPAPTPTPSASATGAPTAVRVAGYRGARVWEAPAAGAELALPPRSEPSLPAVVDLRAADGTPERAPVRALFTEDWRAFALSGTGALFEVDISALDRVTDEGGNRLNPVSAHSLSPDGTRAFFVQDSSVEVLDFTTGRWQTIDVPDWLAEGARWVSPDEIWVPAELGGDAGTVHRLDGSAEPGDVPAQQAWSGEEPWGPMSARGQRVAQDMFLAGPVSGTGVSNPEAVVVRTGSQVDVLTMWPGSSAPRVKGCCEVLGFLDDDTVMFASKSAEGYRLLAWRVGTEQVYLVSRLAGPGAMIDWLPVA